MEHTKGKWAIDGGSSVKGDLFIWKAGNYYGGHAIATVHGEIQEGAEANAHLIAAAPELLRACELTCIVCFRKQPDACKTCIVKAAIEKAKGIPCKKQPIRGKDWACKSS